MFFGTTPSKAVNVTDASPFDLKALASQDFLDDVIYREAVTSTNDLAMELAGTENSLAVQAISAPSNILVLTSDQTRGRGQHGRSWNSAPGSLTFSLLLTRRPAISLERLAPLALATAVGTITALDHQLNTLPGPRPRLAWPNDVVLDNRKIAGILVEPINSLDPAHSSVVVGVGININNRLSDALETIATSLIDHLGHPSPLGDCLLGVLRHIAESIAAWDTGDGRLADSWNRLHRDADQLVTINTPEGPVTGVVQSIDSLGRLILDSADGQRHTIVSGTRTPSQP